MTMAAPHCTCESVIRVGVCELCGSLGKRQWDLLREARDGWREKAEAPHPPALDAEGRERLLDDDGAVLVALREEVGNQLLGEGLLDGEGDPLGPYDPVVERIADQLSSHVKDSLDTFLRNLASHQPESQRRDAQ